MNIAFFCIPAHGHTNPTLAVVRELTARGHTVRYYTTEAFRAKVEAAGAVFVPFDAEAALTDPSYRENAQKLADGFRRCGGAAEAADAIEHAAN